MPKGTVVFELTNGEIRAFQFSPSNSVKFDRIPIPTGILEQSNVQNERLLIDLLSRYHSQLPKGNQKAYLAISQQQGFLQAYSLPWLAKRDRTSAIALLVDEEISIARSDLLYDFLVISEERHKSLRIILGATRQSMLERYVYILEQAGFEVSGVDFAFSVLGQAFGFEPNEDVLYLQEESGRFQVALFCGGVLESVRTLLPPASTSTEGCHSCVAERIEAGEKEIRRFLLYYKTQQTDRNLNRVMWSGDSVTEKLAQRLVETGQVLTSRQAILKSVPDSWQEILQQHVGRSEVVVGYGQQILAHQPVLNLWYQPIWTEKVKHRYLGLACLVSVLLLMGTVLGFSLNQKSLSLQQEVELLSHQGAEIEGQANHQQALEIAWNKGLVRTDKVGEALSQIQALSGVGLMIEQVAYKQGNMSVKGRAVDASSVQTFIRSLRTMGWEQPVLTSYSLTSLSEVEFSISANRGKIEIHEVKER